MNASDRGCWFLVPLLWLAFSGWVGADDRDTDQFSTVKSESLFVHSQMSSESGVVKTLKRGDKVKVDFDLSSGPEEWCSIIETGQTKALGFAECKELDRPPSRSEASRRIPSVETNEKAAERDLRQRTSKVIPTGEYQQLLLRRFDIEFWEARLKFSESQKDQVRELATEAGVGCVRDIAEVYRQYGVWDFMSLAFALQNAQFQRALDRSVPPCAPKFARFWKDFPTLMTPQQREQFESERQATRRTSNPVTGLMMYALRYAGRP